MNTRPLYFIREYAEDYFFHGGIGIIDAERTLESMGFHAIRLPHHFDFSYRAKLVRFLFCLRLILKIESNAIVVFIHPLHARLNKWLINQFRRKKITVICMIGDINGLKDGDAQLLREELQVLNKFDLFIVHNQGMLKWLNTAMPGTLASMIEFFDFLTPPVTKPRPRDRKIVFAANLTKSKFLDDLNQLPLQFNLYGPGITPAIMDQPNVEYHGVIDPYALPQELEGSYGLVWDGDSIHGMEGSLGDYMQYISHHKLSLYILAGLPIIVSCTAGSASLVEKYKIGFCVSSLAEINIKLNSITTAEYESMVNNMLPLANKIAKGGCLSAAINELIGRTANS
jgi:hypothetical protein